MSLSTQASLISQSVSDPVSQGDLLGGLANGPTGGAAVGELLRPRISAYSLSAWVDSAVREASRDYIEGLAWLLLLRPTATGSLSLHDLGHIVWKRNWRRNDDIQSSFNIMNSFECSYRHHCYLYFSSQYATDTIGSQNLAWLAICEYLTELGLP